MDRKSITVIGACLVVFVVWQFVIMPKYWPYKPIPASATNNTGSVESPQSPGGTNAVTSSTPVTTSGTMPKLEMNTNEPEQLIVLTNSDGNAHYTFSSYGGGLKAVELTNFPETIPNWRNRKAQASGFATLNSYTPSPTLAVLGGSAVQGDGIFSLTRTTNGIRAEKELTNGLTIVKEFSPLSNYLVNAAVRLENHSDKALSLPQQEWTVGTATPMNPDDRGVPYIGLMWSDGEKTRDTVGASYFSSRGFACTPKTPPAQYNSGATNIAWAAVHNQFFALAVMAQDHASDVILRKVNLPVETNEDVRPYSSNGYTASLVYPAVTISTNQSVQRQFTLYAGPKEYKTIAKAAAELNNNLDAIMQFDSIFPFYKFGGFFAKALLLIMNSLHAMAKVPYGWAIVLITVVLRLAFWPLTAKSTQSAKKMQTLQPQVKAIQEKYKDDSMKAQKKVMELYKENKVNPMGGCLPALVQWPVFVGFYTMLRCAIELRGAHFLWVTDLSKPDTLFMIPGLNLPFNLLPLLMMGVMLWQTHLTPPSPGMDPGQQKMMRYMPLMFLLFLYFYSSGMALYMFVSTLLGIVQTKMTKMQTAAAATPVLTQPPKKKK